MSKIILETERLILRESTADDAEAVFEFNSNPEVIRYTSEAAAIDVNAVRTFLTGYSDYKKYGYGRWLVNYKPDNKIIGFSGLKYLEHKNATDLGYRFLPEYWGKGIATESSKAVIKYAFEELNLSHLIAFVIPENVNSGKVLKKCGFELVGMEKYEESDEELIKKFILYP